MGAIEVKARNRIELRTERLGELDGGIDASFVAMRSSLDRNIDKVSQIMSKLDGL